MDKGVRYTSIWPSFLFFFVFLTSFQQFSLYPEAPHFSFLLIKWLQNQIFDHYLPYLSTYDSPNILQWLQQRCSTSLWLDPLHPFHLCHQSFFGLSLWPRICIWSHFAGLTKLWDRVFLLQFVLTPPEIDLILK